MLLYKCSNWYTCMDFDDVFMYLKANSPVVVSEGLSPIEKRRKQKAKAQKDYRNRLAAKGLTERFEPTYEAQTGIEYRGRGSKYANEEELAEAKRRAVAKHRAKSLYGLTLEEYDAILERGCEVCGSVTSLCVDHNHDTGKVRGCLCKRCNSALGHLLDSASLVTNLSSYMEKHSHG